MAPCPSRLDRLRIGHWNMAKKKDRAFFVCPRWNEVDAAQAALAETAKPVRVAATTVAAIKAGRPLARSTLREALLAIRGANMPISEIDSYIVDQRVAR